MIQRAALLICGLMTVLIGRVYGGLRQFAPAQEIAWLSFSYALLFVGVIAVGISLLPTAWAQAITEKPSELRRFTPFRFLLSFAALGLLLVAVFSFVPPSLTPPPMVLTYSLCPACVVTVTVDPSLTTALFLLAPLNALVFGAVGGVIGTAFSILSR
jgi:Na+/melibiose symporter-like transporter